ncbi:MAG: phosphatase PAP2 family protein [Bryobacteraceae bacterium]
MVGRWFHQSPILHLAGKWVYLSSILPLAVVYLALPPDIKIRRRLWTSFAVMGLSGVVFYQVCPAAGPIYRFPESFPRYIPLLSAPQARILPHAFLNAMPSLHMALAVLTLMYARHCAKRFQVGAGIFLVLTMLSTLGLGEHYFIDLIVAVPFIVAIDKLPDVVRDRGQRVRVYGCLNAVLFWEIALRQGWALQLSTPIVWVLSIGTVIVPFVPIRSLAKEEDGCGERADVSAISSCALSGASGPSG